MQIQVRKLLDGDSAVNKGDKFDAIKFISLAAQIKKHKKYYQR